MLQKLYTKLVQPHSSSVDEANRELVLNVMLLGVIVLAFVSLLNTITSLLLLREAEFIGRTTVILACTLFFIGVYWYTRARQKYLVGAVVLLATFYAAACSVLYQWGVLTPVGSLLFGLVIVMAGILINARAALYAALVTGVTMAAFLYIETHQIVIPDTTWSPANPNIGDVFGFFSVFAIIALVSWLFNRQMEQSLRRARKSEAALAKQKDMLEIKVEERTRELEAAQLEKIQQVYRFAELGRVSSALFHDLANHLASVSLDIEGLEPEGRSKIMRRIQHDIRYIDDVVQRVRYQLRGQTTIEEFDVSREINQVVKILSYKSMKARVQLKTTKQSTGAILVTGDVTRFRQLIMNLLSNAIEAYPPLTAKGSSRRKVLLEFEQKNNTIVIRVTDWGIGIKPSQKSKVFEPFYSAKAEGTGIGLFIVQQIVEQDLKGTISLRSNTKTGTTFTLRLPLVP